MKKSISGGMRGEGDFLSSQMRSPFPQTQSLPEAVKKIIRGALL